MEPLISVIVPIYNVEKYLERCINSIINQSYKNLEIILIDDGSLDNSRYICDEYKKKDERITVIHKVNGGLSSARNVGLNICKGEYIAFVDSDDWIDGEMYSTLLQLCLKNNAEIAVAGRFNVYENSGIKDVGFCPKIEEILTSEEFYSKLLLGQECDSACCDKLYNRKVWEEVRFPVGRINEDIAVSYEICFRAKRVIMCPKPFYNYYHRQGSITTTFKENFFDCEYFTAQILKFVKEKYPQLVPEAIYFRVKTISYIITVLLDQNKKVRKHYQDKYSVCNKELKELRKIWGKSPLYSKKQKFKYLLQITHLYSFIKKIYIFLKRGKNERRNS